MKVPKHLRPIGGTTLLPSTRTPSSKCGECPCNTRLHFYVPSKPVPDTPCLVVLGTPSAHDVAQKKYLSGGSGKYYTSLLHKAGISKYKVTALVKCQPASIKGTDLIAAAACCKELFDQELGGVTTIIASGELPLNVLCAMEKINIRRGSIYTYKNTRVVPTIDPGSLMKAAHANKEDRKKSKISPPTIVVADMKRVQSIVDNTIVYDEEPFYDIDPSLDVLSDFLARLWEPGAMTAMDIETTYSPVDLAVPEIIAMAFDDQVICVNFIDHLEFIANALISPAFKIFQNGLFDVRVLEGVGFELRNWAFDTMYAHQLLLSELPHSLSFIQSTHTTIPYHKDMVNLKDKDS